MGLSRIPRCTGLDKANVLNAGDKNNSIAIDCIDAERICYGKWTLHSRGGTVWGAGKVGVTSYATGCFICNGSTINGSSMLKEFNAR